MAFEKYYFYKLKERLNLMERLWINKDTNRLVLPKDFFLEMSSYGPILYWHGSGKLLKDIDDKHQISLARKKEEPVASFTHFELDKSLGLYLAHQDLRTKNRDYIELEKPCPLPLESPKEKELTFLMQLLDREGFYDSRLTFKLPRKYNLICPSVY